MKLNINWSLAFKIFLGVTAVVFWVILILGIISTFYFPDPNEELRQYVDKQVNYLTDFVDEENQKTIDYVNEENIKLHDFVDDSNQDTIDQVNDTLGY